jgi:hypothetical protein
MLALKTKINQIQLEALNEFKTSDSNGGQIQALSNNQANNSNAQNVVPADAQLLDFIYKQLEKIDQNNNAQVGISGLNQIELMKIKDQLRRLGTKASPLAPRVADLLIKTNKNQYELAWILIDLTPEPSSADVTELINKYRNTSGTDRIVMLAKIGKSHSSLAIPTLASAISNEDGTVRLIGIIGLGLSGNTSADNAATLLATELKDKENYNRLAAANSLRLMGFSAASATPALIEYLKSRENVFAAAQALKAMPIQNLRPAKPELQSILSDNRIGSFLKNDISDLLVRLDSE